jgi:GH25 family lysozyme M1 (1,4-beta-N-acetylmuramidase)
VNFTSLIRQMQGERRGMGSELREPDPMEKSLATILYPETIWAQPITIQQSVGLSDVSFWQESIDFEKMRRAGLHGVIIRAGQRNWEDIKFKTNWQAAKTAGIPRGSYWFYDSRDTPTNQAKLWAGLLAGDRGELFHACDFEESYGGSYGTKGHFKEFINRFQDLTGLPDDRIVNYTGYYWWLARVGDDIFFRRFGLWIAWYAAMSVVKVPPPWHESELLLWQYTSSGDGTAYGVSSKEIDLNWYAGDAISFTRRFALEPVPPQPPTNGETMYRVRSDFYNMTLRPEHNTGAVGTESLSSGTEMVADELWTATADLWKVINGLNTKVNAIGDKWAHVVRVGSQAKNSWVAITHLGRLYCNFVEVIADVPTITLTHTIEVYSDGSIRVDGSPYP